MAFMSKSKRQKRIVVALDFARPDGPRKLAGIMQFLTARNLHWDIRLKRGPGEFLPIDVLNLPRWNVDGIIYSIPVRGKDAKRAAAALTTLKTPLVVIDPGDEPLFVRNRKRIAFVRTDSASVGEAAANHLTSHPAYHSFGYVSDTLMRKWNAHRGQDFAKALLERGFTTSIYRPPHAGKDDFMDLRRWLKGIPKPAGVLVAYDDRALTVYEACKLENLRIPDDVALISVDDDELLCENFTPTLTSIRPDHEKEGYAAAALLSQLMRGGVIRREHTTEYPVRGITVRSSTLPTAYGSGLVHDALMLIRKKLRTAITPNEIAQELKVSRSLLDLRFRRIRGCTLHAEIDNQRMKLVCERIKKGPGTAKEIAADCGFTDPYYLMRLFKKHYNLTLREYAKSSIDSSG